MVKGEGGGNNSYVKKVWCVQTKVIEPDKTRCSLIWDCILYYMGFYNAYRGETLGKLHYPIIVLAETAKGDGLF